MVSLLEEQNFTGWGRYEIEIENQPSEVTLKYYAIYITGRCDNNIRTISRDKSLKNWDGSDFFTMQGTSIIFISERVQSFLSQKKLKLTNIYIESVEDWILATVDFKAYRNKRWGF